MEIYERIKKIRIHYFNDNNTKFAEFVGEKTTTTSGWTSGTGGKRGIGLNIIQKITNKFPDVNLDWLITGKGNMLKGEPSSNHVGANSRIGANYQGSFAEPINTVIGDSEKSIIGHIGGDVKGNNNNVGITSFNNDKELFKAQQEADYLKREIKSLKGQLKQAITEKDRAIAEKDRAIIDKDRAMSMLEKALSR